MEVEVDHFSMKELIRRCVLLRRLYSWWEWWDSVVEVAVEKVKGYEVGLVVGHGWYLDRYFFYKDL